MPRGRSAINPEGDDLFSAPPNEALPQIVPRLRLALVPAAERQYVAQTRAASMDQLRCTIRSFLGLADTDNELGAAPLVVDEVRGDGFVRKAISYVSDGDSVSAFLFEPLSKAGVTVLAPDAVGFESRCGLALLRQTFPC